MKELTTKEAAEKLSISIRQFQTLIHQERLPAMKKGVIGLSKNKIWHLSGKERKQVARRKTKSKNKPQFLKNSLNLCSFSVSHIPASSLS